jgi:hypothetical protein
MLSVSPLFFTSAVLLVSLMAGMLGSLLGLGGGIIIIPALTLFFHIDIRYAIGASIVSVIATSSGAAAAYVREHMTNLRVAMVLELATTSGALTGAYERQMALHHLRVSDGLLRANDVSKEPKGLRRNQYFSTLGGLSPAAQQLLRRGTRSGGRL